VNGTLPGGEIAAIEAEILAGNPDLTDYALALRELNTGTPHPPKRGTRQGRNPLAREDRIGGNQALTK